MKQPIRYFAIGLLTASLIMLIVVTFFDGSDDNMADQPVDQMIDALKNEGYHVLSSTEYITLSMNKDKETDHDVDEKKDKNEDQKEKEKEKESDKEADKEKDEKDKETEKKKEDKHKYTLTIKENMLGPTVSKLLKEHKIIKDDEKFNRYLEKEGYAGYLQLGDHKVSSDMSHYELAETIARKR